MKIPTRPLRRLRAPAVLLLALALLVQPLAATWSVVVVNTKTGEVCVASATCLANTNLIPDLPVVYPGLGAAAVQSSRDPDHSRKLVIWNGFEAGLTPQEIFDQVAMIGGHNSRQYGIANVFGDPVSWTGPQAGEGKHELAATVGDLRYAIQGNVLTGDEPVLAAEQALLTTPGDLGQKVMAAMEAARAMGGDGRCSCSAAAPTSCGAPPPAPFQSAHTAFIVLARVGDKAGTCGSNAGCANGSYYLKRNSVGNGGPPDPVLDLQAKYDAWRAALAGRPDHLNSVVTPSAQRLVADGVTRLDVHVQLVDVEGVPLTSGGAALTLTNLSGAAVTTASPITDHGDGSYSFALTAGTVSGTDDWELEFDDGVSKVRLYPRLVVPVDPLVPLHSGFETVSASAGAAVPLVANLGTAAGGARYLIVGSTAGTQPGLVFDGGLLPLNPGRFLGASLAGAGQAPFVGTRGDLDAGGRTEGTFLPTPAQLSSLVGQRVDWSAVAFPGQPVVSPPAGFDVVP